MVFMPPQHGKSELVSRQFPAFALGRDPDRRIISCSYNSSLATDMSRDVQKIMASPAYRALFPDSRLASDRDDEVKMAGKFNLVGRGGGYYAQGVGGGITGKSMDIGIIDDPIKSRAEAESETYRRSVWNWYKNDFSTRQKGDHTAIVLVMTRWHTDDLAGRLLKVAAENPGADQWETVMFPAVCDALRPGDPRGLDEALWPGRFSRRWLEAKRLGSSAYDWCTPAETPILMADFTTKRIADVEPGDVVMGFDKRPGRGGRRRLVPTEVLATGVRRAPVCDVEMESGRTVRCTREHKWFKGNWDKAKARALYSPAKVGESLHFAAEPSDTCSQRELMLWHYLAGIVDGEGSVGRSVLVIAQGLDRNRHIYENIVWTLNELGLRFYVRTKRAQAGHDVASIIVCDAATVYRKLIRFTYCAKKPAMVAALTTHGCGRNGRGPDRIVAIREGEVENVYSLRTGTGNYVAWGYLSSNSALYQQTPVPPGGAMAQLAWFPIGERRGVRRRVRAWDLAATREADGRDPDWTVGTLLAECLDGTWGVEHVVRIRETPASVDKVMLQTALADGRSVAIREWEDPGAAGKAVTASHLRMLRGFDYAVVRPSGEKTTQWRPFLVQAECGNVWIAKGDWNRAWLDEMALVPYGSHDDQADSVALAFNELTAHVDRGPSVAVIMPTVGVTR